MYSSHGQPPVGAHGPSPGHLPPLSSPPQWGKLPATTGIPSSNSQVASITTAALMSNNGPASSAADFAITADQLGNVVNFDERANTEQTKLLNAKYGGVDGLAYFLRTHLETGLEVTDPTTMDAVDAIPRQEAFGVNLVPPPPSQTILEMIIENIKEDPIIKILILGAIVTLIIGGIQGDGWVEGIAILSAVAIVLTVTAGNDYSKDKKFKRLLLLQSDKKTKVIRGGRKDQISSWDVMVGDLVELVIGDEIPADGVLVRGNRLVVDESPLTGESIPVKKSAKSPFLFSGCQASEGTGIMLVTAVGARSSGGKIQALLSEAQGQETVLQSKLRGMALSIGKMGFMAGITTFLVLTIRFIIDSVAHYPQGGFPSSDLIRLLRFFNTSVTIVVVCVPEGLPLAVTISLAFSMFKMIKDRCFVRHLEASETMGEATAICTDKTGTLTENRMTVVKTLIARKLIHGEGSGEPDSIPLSASLFSDAIRDVLMEAVCINSTCFIKYKPNDPLPLFVGSATEGALLVMAQKLGYDYDKVRKQTRKVENGEYLFTSDRKRMATLCEPRAALIPGASPPLFRLYVKGASEIILGLCQQQVNSDGMVVPLGGEDREHLFGVIRNWAGDGLRTLALAYRDFDRPLTRAERDDPEHDLVFLGLVGIKDPVRPKVPDAVRVCQEAGIIVRMVTGDNLLTACKIARECSILNDYGIAMEGPVFRELSIPEKKAVIPKLQVLARSSPADKHTLVSLLKEMGEVVAVTGDGTNDAPALKEADVGFAMGISGTQISMNASDIILLDDNFVSIVQSIKWGRNVLNAVRKFLQFQLSVNVVAICTTIIGAIANDESPLTPVQLLWVNLIMDTFGALALASDVPDPKLLKQKPHRRHDPILTRPMTVYVFTCALYQVVILMTILFHAEQLLYPSFNAAARGISGRRWTMTILFTTFVLMQVVNKVLARQLNFELNFLRGTTKNPLFPLMIFCILFIQTLIVQFAGDFVRTVPLTGNEWGLCIAFALGMIPYQTVIRSCVYFYRLQKFGPNYQVHAEHTQHPHPAEATLSQQTGGKTASNGKSLPEQQPLKQSTILKSSSVARSPADLGE